MFCKIFKRGRGKASGIDYLINQLDAAGKPRTPPAKVLRGDATLTKKLIRSIQFTQRYTSGVLSWSEQPGAITEDVLAAVMNGFENMVGVGMASDSLNWLWVLHRDKNRIELHFVIPNVDLHSGKRFAPYFHRSDLNRFRAWERYTNAAHGFSDPSDPALKRNTRLPDHLPQDKKFALNAVNDAISAMIRLGHVKNRTDIIHRLKDGGYKINRQGRDYISIQDQAGRKLRLKGAYYEAGFRAGEVSVPTQPTTEQREARNESLYMDLQNQLIRRGNYVSGRYRPIATPDIDATAHFQPETGEPTPPYKQETEHDRAARPGDYFTDPHRTATERAIRRVEFATDKLERSAEQFFSIVERVIGRIREALVIGRCSAKSPNYS